MPHAAPECNNGGLVGDQQVNGQPLRTEPSLRRSHFTTKRVLEFFTEKELTMQIGHPIGLWPVALLKELIDNALDAAESAGAAPVIEALIEGDAVAVQDNGPGLPRQALLRSLDYTVRVSDKAHYVSPTRGQLGNALECLWAAPFVASGKRGCVEVVSRGEHHRIDVALDPIAQEPDLGHVAEPAAVRTGTLLRMHWPQIASYLSGVEAPDSYRGDPAGGDDDYDDEDSAPVLSARWLVQAFAAFNPHAAFRLQETASTLELPAAAAAWRKWRPDDPTCPHWYTADRLRNLLAAYLAEERGGAAAGTVRDFVGEFRGLTGTSKRMQVLEAAGLSGATLADLVVGNDVDRAAVCRLLGAMQAAARPVKPKALGVIGEAHLAACLVRDHGADADSIRYKWAGGEADGLPFVLEVALGVKGEDCEDDGREVTVGLNRSPALALPFVDLPQLLGEMRVDAHDPVVVLVHLACPRLDYTDRGKARLELPPALQQALARCIRSVAGPWKRAKRQADRDDRLEWQELDRQRRARRARQLSIGAAAYRVMEQAYLHASDNGRLPANARQIMYAARPHVLELTGGRCWKHSSYFTQRLLPDFINAHPDLTCEWDVVYDARGRLHKPHTGRTVNLGTVQVRRYLGEWTDGRPAAVPEGIALEGACPTAGPVNRYRFALFVEKEGFDALLQSARVAERYDLAIMSTKGMSVTAARQLVERLSERGV
ncbi:MAG TPA: hypothetical protein VJ739_05030, partial [Gemmataceae bacterium]|nr:hypothetical protein [Gemmataceae bacterium]